ncbi:MAG: short chain dehydrogenase, partial [Actinomycetota bacterium]
MHVVVTGGSRGIGEAMAREFAKRGARVTVVARSADSLNKVASSISGNAVVAD